MATVVYKLVLEGLVPEANDERVRSFLARIFGEAGVAAALSENFPRDVPGEFDFQRASEWMEALARAGVRSRVEISGVPLAASQLEAEIPEPWLPAPVKNPIKLWFEMLTSPESAYTWLADAGIMPAIVFGLLLICLGNALAYPGELWLLGSVIDTGIAASSPVKLWTLLVLIEPPFRLLLEALGVAVIARLLGANLGFAQAAAIAGPAHAADLLKALPILGPVLAWLAFVWLTAVGLTTQQHLDAKRGIAYALLPFAGLLLAFAGFAALLIGVISSIDASALSAAFTDGFRF